VKNFNLTAFLFTSRNLSNKTKRNEVYQVAIEDSSAASEPAEKSTKFLIKNFISASKI